MDSAIHSLNIWGLHNKIENNLCKCHKESSFLSTSCGLYKQCYCVLFFNSHVEDTTNVIALSYSSQYQHFKYLYKYLLINLAESYDSPLSLYQKNTIAPPLCSFKIALAPYFSPPPYINNDRSLSDVSTTSSCATLALQLPHSWRHCHCLADSRIFACKTISNLLGERSESQDHKKQLWSTQAPRGQSW